MVKVYVAGRYNEDSVIKVLHNMKEGIELGVKLMKFGYAPFIPWLDFQVGLHADFDVDTYKACSMEWVKVSDAVLLVSTENISCGVRAEIEMAKSLNIPVYGSLSDLERDVLFNSEDYPQKIVDNPHFSLDI